MDNLANPELSVLLWTTGGRAIGWLSGELRSKSAAVAGSFPFPVCFSSLISLASLANRFCSALAAFSSSFRCLSSLLTSAARAFSLSFCWSVNHSG